MSIAKTIASVGIVVAVIGATGFLLSRPADMIPEPEPRPTHVKPEKEKKEPDKEKEEEAHKTKEEPPPATNVPPAPGPPPAPAEPPPPASPPSAGVEEPKVKQVRPRRRTVQKAPSAPAPAMPAGDPVTFPARDGEEYDVRFTSDAAFATNIRKVQAWTYACSRGTLFLVTPGSNRARGNVAKVDKCEKDVRVRLRLRQLERPTPELIQALDVDAEDLQWYLQLNEDTLGRRVDEALALIGANPKQRPLVEIGADGSVRLVPRAPRIETAKRGQ